MGRWTRIGGAAAAAGSPDRATFGIGIGAVQPVGNDLTCHFMVREVAGSFIEAVANCKTPNGAAANPLYIDIEVSRDEGDTWASIFPTLNANKIVVPVNDATPGNRTKQVTVTTFAAAPDNAVAIGDWLRINLLAGSDAGSQDIEVVVRWG